MCNRSYLGLMHSSDRSGGLVFISCSSPDKTKKHKRETLKCSPEHHLFTVLLFSSFWNRQCAWRNSCKNGDSWFGNLTAVWSPKHLAGPATATAASADSYMKAGTHFWLCVCHHKCRLPQKWQLHHHLSPGSLFLPPALCQYQPVCNCSGKCPGKTSSSSRS